MRKLGLWLSLCVIAPAAQAAAYVFPGNFAGGLQRLWAELHLLCIDAEQW